MDKDYKWAINEKKKKTGRRKNANIDKYKKIVSFIPNQRNTNYTNNNYFHP